MSNDPFFTPFNDLELMPVEEKLEIKRKEKKLSIGIPKETCLDEMRTCVTPDAVQVLTDAGHQIIIERGAGNGSFFTDQQYADAGAQLTDSASKAFSQDLILKINPPTVEEIQWMKPNAYLISALQINLRDKEYFLTLAKKKITAIAFEFITDEYQQLPLVRLIGEIAGTASILYASELLAQSNGNMLGGITGVRPTKVVIIGAGIVGEFAAKAALGLGADVKVFDNSLSKLRRLHTSIGARIPTSIIEPKELQKNLRRADVLIGCMHKQSNIPIVSEDMVMKMKNGSIIIDVGIDYGKVVETSEITTFKAPYFVKHGVVHSGLPNLTSRVPRLTSKAISNFFLTYLLNYDEEGGFENMLMNRDEVKHSLYMYRGRHTKKILCNRFDLPYCDINLLMI